MKRSFSIFLVSIGLVFSLGCNKGSSDLSLTDIDGNHYAVVQIGNAYWMAENLKVTRDKTGQSLFSYCYEERTDRCDDFGRLYTWQQALEACPDGWKLPDSEDWTELEIELGMDPTESMSFGWRGTDQGAQLKEGGSSGFNALLAGYKDGILDWDGRYFDIGFFGSFWSASSSDTTHSVAYWVYVTSDRILKNNYDNTSALSVRCIKEE